MTIYQHLEKMGLPQQPPHAVPEVLLADYVDAKAIVVLLRMSTDARFHVKLDALDRTLDRLAGVRR